MATELLDSLPARALLEAIPSLLVVFDPSLRVAMANEAARAALGLGEGAGVDAAGSADLGPAVRAAFSGGLPVRIEQTRVVVRGAERVFGFSASPVRLGTRVLAVLVTGKDLTEHVTLRREIRGLEQAADVEKVVRKLSHELRNPLNALRGHAQFAALQLETSHPARASVDVVVAEVDRMERVLQGLRDLTRAGRLELTMADPARCLSDALVTAGPLFAAKGVVPAAQFEEPLPRLLFDPTRLHQVVLNLLKNAAEAVDFGGDVRLGAGALPDGGLWIEVDDDGPGVDPALGERVFDLFVTTKAGSGEGIGLAVCQEIVCAHGGRIARKCRPGGGASFRVELPCH